MIHPRRVMSTVLFVSIVLIGLSVPVEAKPFEGQEVERRFLSDKFYYSVGWFGADISTDIAFGFGSNVGTTIRLEDDFDLEDSKDATLFEATWRFSRKHALMFSTTQLNRKGVTNIDKSIEIELPGGDPDDGLRFSALADISTDFDNNIFGFIYRYSFYNNGRIDAGISAGLSFYDFELGLAGQAAIIDEDGMEIRSEEFDSVSTDFIAPIPTIGIHLAYSLSPRFLFRFHTNLLDMDFGDYEGRINLSKTTIEWFFVKHVSFGIGVTTNNIEVVRRGDDPFRVDYRYGGLTVFFAAGF